MKILIGADHAGYRLKERLKEFLSKMKYKVEDYGTHSEEPVDYPKIGYKLAQDAAKKKCMGILICGSGIGMSIVANKIKRIRASLCNDEYTAEIARKHNNANILCLGARTLEIEEAKRITLKWLDTDFSTEERHKRRVNQMNKLE